MPAEAGSEGVESDSSVSLELQIEDPDWLRRIPDLEVLSRQLLAITFEELGLFPSRAVEVSLRLVDDEEIRRLNRSYRSRDRATDVLSFPALEGDAVDRLREPGPPLLLGDVVVALGTVLRDAAARAEEPRNRFAHVFVHGLLHLLGYDHHEPQEAERMEALERRILRRKGMPDPYALRV